MVETDGRLRAVCHGYWRTSPRERLDARLLAIFDGVRALIAEHAPDSVALEESYVGADARIALSIGQARGAILVAAAGVGRGCVEYAPTRIKQSLTGYGHADKAQVQRMVNTILHMDEPPRSTHAADALAVAICHALCPPMLRAVS